MAGGLCQAKDAGVKHTEFGGEWEEAGEREEERNVNEQRNVQPLWAGRLVGSLLTPVISETHRKIHIIRPCLWS